MKACKVSFALPFLLEHIGLDNQEGLIVYQSSVDPASGIVTLYLTGYHPALPDVREGEEIPLAIIKAKRIESRLEVAGRQNESCRRRISEK